MGVSAPVCQILALPVVAVGLILSFSPLASSIPFEFGGRTSARVRRLFCRRWQLVMAVGSFFLRPLADQGETSEWFVQCQSLEGSNRAVLGRCDLPLWKPFGHEKREWMDSSVDLRAIQKIAQTDDYAFVYISSVNAIVIPLNRFPEDEYRDFVADLLEAWENRDAPRPTEAPDERIRSTKRLQNETLTCGNRLDRSVSSWPLHWRV